MPYIVKQKVNGKYYYYLRKSFRKDGKVISKHVAYLGKTKEEAEENAKKFKEEGKMKKDTNEEIGFEKKEISVEDLAVFCKRRGIVYPSGEIYGGLAGFFDYGPIGVELKNNLKKAWWDYHVRKRQDIAGIDGAIITNPKTWKASGHVDSFSDLMVKCKKCKKISKLDKSEFGNVNCECGGEYENLGELGLMFKTQVGPYKKDSSEAYLRPETAQLIFNNFKYVQENARMKLPFGIAQVGRAFRNEIAPRDFLFRLREFEQMEIEYFINPEDEKCPFEIPEVEILVYSNLDQENKKEPVKMRIKEAFKKGIIKKDWHAYWLATELLFFKSLGVDLNNFRIRQHEKNELAHYSSDCWDLEYKFPFGWKELQGIADRSDYDLSQHEKHSGKDLKIFDEKTKEKILPHVICEPSLGVERAFLVLMIDSYFYDKNRDNIVLKLNPKISPIKAGIFPLVKREEFKKIAQEMFRDLSEEWNVIYDESGSVGRRYARQDEIGTPFCLTIDDDSIKNKDVTIRDRDTTKQIRVKISELKNIFRKLINQEIAFLDAGKEIK